MRQRNEAGTTLVEIVLALVVLGAIVASFMSALVTTTTSSKSQRDLVTADAVLRDYAEATKQAVRSSCVNGATAYTVAYTPPSGFAVAGAGSVCPPTTGSLALQVPTLHLVATLPSGATKTLDVAVRTP